MNDTTLYLLAHLAALWLIITSLCLYWLCHKIHQEIKAFHDACEAEDLGPERDAAGLPTPCSTLPAPCLHFPGETHAEIVPIKADISKAMQPCELDTRTAQIQHLTPSAPLR